MLRLLDRQLILSYLKAYPVCLVSVLGLCIVVDLFTNLDEFTQKQALRPVLEHIGKYYSYKSTQIFDRLCEAIVLLAAMFTVAWMQRNNEQVPLLSAGISTRRIVLPVLLSAFFMLGLTVLNQEFIIPRIADKLALDKDDPDGEKSVPVRSAYDSNGIHITGDRAVRQNLTVYGFYATIVDPQGGQLFHLSAKEARYVPDLGRRQGGWELVAASPTEVPAIPGILEQRDLGRY